MTITSHATYNNTLLASNKGSWWVQMRYLMCFPSLSHFHHFGWRWRWTPTFMIACMACIDTGAQCTLTVCSVCWQTDEASFPNTQHPGLTRSFFNVRQWLKTECGISPRLPLRFPRHPPAVALGMSCMVCSWEKGKPSKFMSANKR